MHFYSPKAYEHLRKYLTLPSKSTLNNWASSINCEPGFPVVIFDALAELIKNKPWMSDCSLCIDEMAIHKGTVWDPKAGRFIGFIDYGQGHIGNDAPLATNALVLMAVGLNGSWKHPVGYAFTNHINSSQLSVLVKTAICKLHDINATVRALIFDGCSSNISMARQLGANFDPNNIISSFPNPAQTSEKIAVVFDACHMLKLVRNLLCEYGILKIGDEYIEWRYIKELFNLQEAEQIRAATKLTENHILYKNQKMKVRLAAQVLSSSVANGIDFARDDLKLEKFKGSEATSQFLRDVDKSFDILNSRTPMAKGFKAPISKTNFESKINFLNSFTKILFQIDAIQGKKIISGRRKTSFIGLAVTFQSITTLSKFLLFRPNFPFKYLLTYKLSQDHLELFFGVIRRCGGWNNNPNARQFKYAFRKLVQKNSVIPAQTGNCQFFVEEADKNELVQLGLINKEIDEDEVNPEVALQTAILAQELSDFTQNCLSYIGGYIARSITKKIKCTECTHALCNSKDNPISDSALFLITKKK